MRQLKRYEQKITGRENETIVCFIVFLVFPEGLNPLDHIVKTVRCRKLLQNTCSGERVPNTNARNLFLGAIVFFCFVFQFGALFLVICSCGTKICNLLHFGAKISHSHAICSILELKLFLDGTCNILDLGRLLVRKNAASWNQHLHAIVCIMFTVN